MTDVTDVSRPLVLVVDDEPAMRSLMSSTLRASDYEVIEAASGADALDALKRVVPAVIVSDVMMPDLDGFGLVRAVRADPSTRAVPLVFATTRSAMGDVVHGLGLGADDYIVKPFDPNELIARVGAKVARPSIPAELVPVERSTGAATRSSVSGLIDRELARSARRGVVAHVRIAELATLRSMFGTRGLSQVERQITSVLAAAVTPADVVGRDGAGGWLVVLGDVDERGAPATLARLAREVNDTRFEAGDSRVVVTPSIGWSPMSGDSAADLIERAMLASDAAESHLDLTPVEYTDALRAAPGDGARRRSMMRRTRERLRTPLQFVITLIIGLVLPYVAYAWSASAGFDLAGGMYIVVVVALLITGALIWWEGFASLRRIEPPDEPASPYPAASAIIAAYLPNEAATVLDTVEAFLRVDYPGPLQVVLAYNTPHDHPVERLLEDLGERDPRFVPFRVHDSTSKAQNVNAALAIVDGEFTGVFDADHHPAPDSFRRAWRWISHGADVVQGHPVVRNGDASLVARTVAVEFEAIYAVSHPGRARLHRFGIFGGSNGYWRTDLLRSTRMRGRMLTEDIDSSLRVVADGHTIVSDPGLVSRELATTTLRQLWNQRMRWAQGWFQVSIRHTWGAMRSSSMSWRQKAGFLHLLAWREIYPWISIQMFPIVAFWLTRQRDLDWFVPVFVLTSAFTLTVGPGQAIFAYRNAAPEIKQHRWWFISYLIVASLVYTEFKNAITRVSQVKEAMGDRQWKVTPRSNQRVV